MHGCWGNGWLLVRLCNAEIESGETLILARHVDAGLEVGMIDGETLYYFHMFNS
jgi:hypothetical protein